MTFHEVLPNQCPPPDAIEDEIVQAYRLVPLEHCDTTNFESKAKKGEPMPLGHCGCEWSSCSLFAKVSGLRKLTRLRQENPYLATVSIPAGAGKHTINAKSSHIHYWPYKDNCPSRFLVSVSLYPEGNAS